MTAGMLYTINLSGDEGGVADTFLSLYDSKGGFIKQNDDIKGEEGNLNSSFQFVPEVSGYYYISAGAYTGNVGQTNEGAYTVTVMEMPAGIPDPIEGTNMDDKLRGTDTGERITGLEGNDSLFGFDGDDTLNGGSGDDDVTGGGGDDTYVFTVDGLGSDVILDFTATVGDAATDNTGDKIDLSAFDIDDSELAGLLSERAGAVIVNLESYGGGRITIRDADGVALADLRDAAGNYHFEDANSAPVLLSPFRAPPETGAVHIHL